MVFTYDPGSAHAALMKDGYAHLRGILAAEFLADLKAFLAKSMAEAAEESKDWKITGKKRQFVYEFPSTEAAEAFRAGMARLTGIGADDFTISERHLKVYDEAANPWPAPHKDRSASHYSIGLPVSLSPGSTVCVFPDLEPGSNTEERAVFLDTDAPERLYQSDKAVMLNEGEGDIVIFLGSALWHERVKAAGTAVLYIKANGAGDDPLGENIYAKATA